MTNLLRSEPRVMTIGLPAFADDLSALGVKCLDLDWVPPAGGDPGIANTLARLADGPGGPHSTANQQAVAAILAGDPVLVDVVPAGDAIPALEPGLVLHSGPPVTWDRMCGPMQGAIGGAAAFEGWAGDLSEAARQARDGEYRFSPNHAHDAVGPMTGITTMSQPVMVVENRASGNRAYCTVNEGLGKVLRFGGNDPEVLNRLQWIRDEFGPLLGRAVRSRGGLPLKNIVARGLSMGDEMHQRNVACSSLTLRSLAPALAGAAPDTSALARALDFIAANDQFFLNLAMAMAKSMTDAVKRLEMSTIVTAMARNGTDFGIKVAGCGDAWFTAPVEMPEGLYFPGYSAADANPDIGDSAIVETIGLGGFAMGAAPAVAGFVGAGAASEAGRVTDRMREITVAENSEWTIPAMDYQGVPVGIDVRLVVESGIAPVINTGIAHRKPGIGQVGAGIVRAPMACFEAALAALAAAVQP
ncbi:MAG: DUF1116 domain-containing protein [Rhodobacteraceae bacterium]|nr:DUF1116 domain-containing protein [Paracoccaceae bacterium]